MAAGERMVGCSYNEIDSIFQIASVGSIIAMCGLLGAREGIEGSVSFYLNTYMTGFDT